MKKNDKMVENSWNELKKDGIPNTQNTQQPAYKCLETTNHDLKKDNKTMNLMLVRKRTEINRQCEIEFQVETEQQENPINGIQLEALKESVEKEEHQELPLQIKAEDEELIIHSLTYDLEQHFRTRPQ